MIDFLLREGFDGLGLGVHGWWVKGGFVVGNEGEFEGFWIVCDVVFIIIKADRIYWLNQRDKLIKRNENKQQK